MVLNREYWQSRFRIFTSNGGEAERCANTFEDAKAAHDAGNMPCPEQVGRAASCGECQMCMPGPHSQGERFGGSIGFIRHQIPRDEVQLKLL